MRLVKFNQDRRNGEGFLEGNELFLSGEWRDGAADDAPFLLAGMDRESLARARGAARVRIPRAEVRLALPLDPRAKVICVGLNYRDHVAEARDHVEEAPANAPAQPALFTREMDSLVGPEDALICPKVSASFDYEGELAVVIGRPTRHVSREEAAACIGGYSCFMDGSVREYQQHSVSAGKNFWRSGSMGPSIVTADDVPLIGQAALSTRVNGETVQSASIDMMIFDIASIISYCSRWTVLNPGDVIATGSPAGVGAARKPPLWLKPGDRVEVEITDVGLLENPVEQER